MLRAMIVGTFWCMAFAQSRPEPEIVQAARSPYELARYVDTHVGFEWKPLWEKFGLARAALLPCPRPDECSTELITVLDPEQTILVIDTPWDTQAYFRYLGNERKGWRQAGAFSLFIKNYPRRHEITRMDGKPFLRVSEQGYSGSGLSSEVEHWIDLSRPEFDPVFSFTPQGVEHRLGFGISRTVHAHAIADRDETIRVVVTLRYTGYAESIELGRAELTATYQRLVGRPGFALRDVTQGASATTVATEKFEKLINLDEGGASNAMLIAEVLPGLKKIASGDNADAKGWLRHMLSNVKDTPEKRQLMKLLDER